MRDRTEEAGDAVVLRALEDAVRASCGEHFPELDRRRLVLELTSVQRRASCSLFRLQLTDGGSRRTVLAKTRRDRTAPRAGAEAGRPALAPAPAQLPASAAAQLEHEGLRRIASAVEAAGDPRFGRVRPLCVLPEHATLVMDFVELDTLRTGLLRRTRLRTSVARQDDVAVWRHAGAVLGRYHSAPGAAALPARLTAPAELEELLGCFVSYLSRRGVPSALLDLVVAGADSLLPALPTRLHSSVGHGDFTPRNVFVGPGSRVLLFDPMPRWRVPVAEDLATFVVATRLVGPQLATRGAAFSRRQLDRYEAALLEGYAEDGGGVSNAEVAVFTLLALLDRWAWLVSAPLTPSPWRRRLLVAKQAWLRQEVHREARRLLTSPS